MSVTFLATISMLQSAIQIAGDGGARLKLDIDDTGMDAVMALSAMRGQLLTVTVEVDAEKQHENSNASELATREKRQPKWTTTQRPHVDGLDRQGGPEEDHTP